MADEEELADGCRADAAVAVPGCVQTAEEGREALAGGDQGHGYGEGREGSREIVPDGRGDDVAYEAGVVRGDDVTRVLTKTWVGQLPPPEDFARYPEDVQKEIVWCMRAQAESNKAVVDSAVENDRRESDRLDRFVEAEISQSTMGTWMTFVLQLLIIAGAAYVSVGLGSAWPIVAALGGTVAINVIPPLFTRDK